MHGRFSRFPMLFLPVCAAILVASCDTGSPTGPRIVSLNQVSGNEQAAPVGATLADPIVVRAVDQNGVPVPGVALEWEVVSGGGTLIAASTSTNQSGLGQAIYRLGNSIGSNQVSVTVGSQAPMVFSLTATAAPASQLRTSSGNNQSGTAGAALAAPIVAIVTDAVGNPKAGVPVAFTVASGGGSLSSASVLSNASGLASVTWTLGTGAGAQAVIATSSGLPAVTFSGTAVASVASTMIIVSGNNQVASPGVALSQPIRIRVNDQYGNGVPGVPVTFTTTLANGVVSPPSSLTGADGSAQGTWTLGPAGGLKVAIVAAGGLLVTFNAGSTVNYTNISVGGNHACAVSTDNVLYCWGYNGEGQLGIGVPAVGSGPVYAYPQPSAATGNHTFRTTVNSLYHGCGITLAGAGFCWGVNHDGRLGIGTLSSVVNAPVQIGLGTTGPGAHSFRALGVSRNHTCGITFAERMYCWGYGLDGQLGTGGTPLTISAPETEVAGNLQWAAVATGGLHTCAITLGGGTLCWGVNLRGELGDGTTTNRAVPTVVAGGPAFVRVASGYEHSCALSVTGEAWCWGDNTYGQLGDASNTSSTVPVLVAGGMAFESISAGMHHTCGVVGTPPSAGGSPIGGTVFCWGRNNRGQLGDGSQVNRSAPAATAGVTFVQISAGDLATCAITSSNLAYCWGDNQYGQLGDGTTTLRLTPRKVAFQP